MINQGVGRAVFFSGYSRGQSISLDSRTLESSFPAFRGHLHSMVNAKTVS